MQIDGIEIVDLTGKTVQRVNSNYAAINVASLAKGVYMLKVNTATGPLTQKFVKI